MTPIVGCNDSRPSARTLPLPSSGKDYEILAQDRIRHTGGLRIRSLAKISAERKRDSAGCKDIAAVDVLVHHRHVAAVEAGPLPWEEVAQDLPYVSSFPSKFDLYISAIRFPRAEHASKLNR